MNARQTDLSRAMTEAIRRAADGRSFLTSAFTRTDQLAAALPANGQAVPVMTTGGDFYFLADYDEADGPAIAE